MVVDNPTQNIWQQAKDAIDKSRFVQQVQSLGRTNQKIPRYDRKSSINH